MLQNHYRDHEWPVRPRARWARAVQQQRAARLRSASAGEALLRIAPALVLLVVLTALRPTIAPLLPPQVRGGYMVLVAVACLAVTVLVLVGASLGDRWVPVREQRRYRELSGAAELTARQQQLLALDAQSDHSFGGWNSSLEYAPTWRCLPRGVRRTWEQREDRPLFRTLPMVDLAQLRAEIDARHHVASTRDLELAVADLLTTGGVSARYTDVLRGPDGDRALARLSSLTGRDEWELRDLSRSVAGRAPELLRGGDVQWAVTLTRLCYVAEQVDEATAWRLVGSAGDVAASLFGSWDEYWTSVRTAVAFGSDSLDAVQRFDASLAALRDSAWPAARVPWLARSGPTSPGRPWQADDTLAES